MTNKTTQKEQQRLLERIAKPISIDLHQLFGDDEKYLKELASSHRDELDSYLSAAKALVDHSVYQASLNAGCGCILGVGLKTAREIHKRDLQRYLSSTLAEYIATQTAKVRMEDEEGLVYNLYLKPYVEETVDPSDSQPILFGKRVQPLKDRLEQLANEYRPRVESYTKNELSREMKEIEEFEGEGK